MIHNGTRATIRGQLITPRQRVSVHIGLRLGEHVFAHFDVQILRQYEEQVACEYANERAYIHIAWCRLRHLCVYTLIETLLVFCQFIYFD